MQTNKRKKSSSNTSKPIKNTDTMKPEEAESKNTEARDIYEESERDEEEYELHTDESNNKKNEEYETLSRPPQPPRKNY